MFSLKYSNKYSLVLEPKPKPYPTTKPHSFSFQPISLTASLHTAQTCSPHSTPQSFTPVTVTTLHRPAPNSPLSPSHPSTAPSPSSPLRRSSRPRPPSPPPPPRSPTSPASRSGCTRVSSWSLSRTACSAFAWITRTWSSATSPAKSARTTFGSSPATESRSRSPATTPPKDASFIGSAAAPPPNVCQNYSHSNNV